MTWLLILISAGLATAQATRFQTPRYRLSPGTKLWYTGEAVIRDARGLSHSFRLREHWVLAASGGVFRVLMRVADRGYSTDTAGVRTDESAETGWELFEMEPDGRLVRDQSTVRVDVSVLFPLLPPDSAGAMNGWQQVDTFVGSVDHWRLGNKSLSDSLWLMDRTQSTPFDSVYGPSIGEARLAFDTRRGLPVWRESRSADTAWKRESQGSIVLDSVTKFDPARLPPQLRAIIDYFDLKLAYEEQVAGADPADTSDAAGDRALVLLRDALSRAQDSVVIELLSMDIEEHERTSEYMSSQARDRLEQLGAPAPRWKLRDLDGREHSLEDYRGRVLVLDWWYKDCPWCILAMPLLTEVAQRYADRPVAVLGMNVDRDTGDARFAVEKCKPGYPSLLAGRELAKEYGVTVYPTLLIVDRQGRIADVRPGYAKDLAARVSAVVDSLLGP